MPPKSPSANAGAAPATGADRVQQLRDWILAAEHEGADKSDLRLNLTHRDAATLKRHPSVASNEIAFSAGGMRFLGVQVTEGGADSVLERGAK